MKNEQKQVFGAIEQSDVGVYSKHLWPDIAVANPQIISLGDTEDTLYLKGVDISNVTEGTFVYDDEYGISWGLCDYNTPDDYIEIDVPEGFNRIRIVYTGFYNNPSAGLGWMKIEVVNSSTTRVFDFSDSWTDANEGQRLHVNNKEIIYKQKVDIVNREDIVEIGFSEKIRIRMGGYTTYPYTRRYIKELEFVKDDYDYGDLPTDNLAGLWTFDDDYSCKGYCQDIVPGSSCEIIDGACRLENGYFEYNTPEVGNSFAMFTKVSVETVANYHEFIHFMTEPSDQSKFTFKANARDLNGNFKPYLYANSIYCLEQTTLVPFRKDAVVGFSIVDGVLTGYIDGVVFDSKNFDFSISYNYFRYGYWSGEYFTGDIKCLAVYSNGVTDKVAAKISDWMMRTQ